MNTTFATVAGSATKNEDWAGATENVAVVLDGLTALKDNRIGCGHGTVWYVKQLGVRLLVAAGDPENTLKQALSLAIKEVAALHPECDLDFPGTPSATVAMVRVGEESVDYLVLADAVVVIETRKEVQAFSDHGVDAVAADERTEGLRHPIGSPEQAQALSRLIEAQRKVRNTDEGYWIAGSNPQAAEHTITGSVARAEFVSAAVLSDGASRLVDSFEVATWEELLKILESAGPLGLINQVRELEADDPTGTRWPRYKCSDDATALFMKP